MLKGGWSLDERGEEISMSPSSNRTRPFDRSTVLSFDNQNNRPSPILGVLFLHFEFAISRISNTPARFWFPFRSFLVFLFFHLNTHKPFSQRQAQFFGRKLILFVI